MMSGIRIGNDDYHGNKIGEDSEYEYYKKVKPKKTINQEDTSAAKRKDDGWDFPYVPFVF